jgi:PHP family Zn ribbon phosphoesterase
VADAIVRVRQRQVTVVPGFDGVYGRLVLSDSDSDKVQVPGTVQQRNLTDFM